mgnify:CR=1 FL=1
MDTSARDCMVLFDTSVEGKLACGWDSGVLHQRTRTVKAGPMVYVDCYPVWDTAHARAASTEAKKEAHARAQKRLDAKNRANRLERLVNANFSAGDIMLTCEYPAGRQPGSDEQAKRDIRNMMNRVKRMRSRRGLPALRYIYITERTESAAYGVRWHHHVIMSGDGLTRGVFHECVEYAKARWASLRIDTHRDNLPMQRHILREGFVYCGVIRTRDGTERLAYQWDAPCRREKQA